MPQFGAQIDTLRIPIKGLIPEQSASALGSPVEGLCWHDTVNKHLFAWLNGVWVQLDNAGATLPANVTDGDKGAITVSGGVWSLDAGTVGTSQIIDGSVANGDLAPNAVTTDKILDGTVAAGDLNTSSVRLDTIGVPTGPVSMNGQRITSVGDPTGAQDAATKAYVDSVASGLDPKASVKAATTANIALSGAQTLDGIAVNNGDRVLVKNQTNPQENGIYQVSLTAWQRTNDLDTWTEVPGAFTFVEQGTTQADTGWVSTADAGGTIGTTAMPWSQFSGAGTVGAGAGLSQSGTTLNVGAGTGITVQADTVSLDTAYTDGRYVDVAGDSMSGPLQMTGTNNYIRVLNSAVAQDLRMTGGGYTFTNPTGTYQAGTNYDIVSHLLTLQNTGGELRLDGTNVTVPSDPDQPTEVANKRYVDAAITTATTGTVKKYTGSVTLNSPGTYVTVTGIPGTLGVPPVSVEFVRGAGSDTTPIELDWKVRSVQEDFQVKADVAVGLVTVYAVA